jgi:hypothetical protein
MQEPSDCTKKGRAASSESLYAQRLLLPSARPLSAVAAKSRREW